MTIKLNRSSISDDKTMKLAYVEHNCLAALVSNLRLQARGYSGILLSVYANLCYVTNWYKMADFQTLNCRYSFRIQAMWPKFCMTLVTSYDLLSYQNLEPLSYSSLFWTYPSLHTSRLVAMLWQHQKSVYTTVGHRVGIFDTLLL